MTTFSALARICGLSQTEIVELLSVSSEALQAWLTGNPHAPPGALDAIHKLVSTQHRAASEGAAVILARLYEHGMPEAIELGAATDDHEARSLGWPTASAHLATLGMTIAMLPPDLAERIRVVPRGSTPASAAAEKSHIDWT